MDNQIFLSWSYAGHFRFLAQQPFEHLMDMAFGPNFCDSSKLEQLLPFRVIFVQNIGSENISTTKKLTISVQTSIHANFLMFVELRT